jgi:ribosome-associated protein
MLSALQQEQILEKEIRFRTSRSGGKGGQNVNKVESRVELIFDFSDSQVLSKHQVEKLRMKLPDQQEIRITSDSDRSQLRNKEIAREKLAELLNRLLKPEKKRKKTNPSIGSRERKKRKKQQQSEKKAMRRKEW